MEAAVADENPSTFVLKNNGVGKKKTGASSIVFRDERALLAVRKGDSTIN